MGLFSKEGIVEALRDSVLELKFYKKDQSERVMYCTLSDEVLPETLTESNGGRSPNQDPEDDQVVVWDIEADAWRSFKMSSLFGVSHYRFIDEECMKNVMMFGAAWCGPCKSAKQTFLKLKEQVTDVEFEYIDIDEEAELAESFGIRSVPSFFLYEGEQRIKEAFGGNTNLKEFISG